MRIFLLLLYGCYNIFSIIVSIYVISFLNTYVNSFFIPNGFRWNDEGVLRDDLTLFGITQFVITNIEALLIIVAMYFINKYYLGRVVKVGENGKAIVFWTEVTLCIAFYVLIFRYFYFIYK